MKSISLGFKAPDYSKMSAQIAAPTEPPTKECFPQLTIAGDRGLAKHLRPEQEFTALVTFRVAEVCIRERSGGEEMPDPYGGTHVDLDAISMQIKDMPQDDDDGEESGGSAIDAWFKKKD